MINTVYHLLARNNEKRGGLINFLPLKKKAGKRLLESGGLYERGGSLIEDLRYVLFARLG